MKPLKLLRGKRSDDCKVHGTGSRAANRTLLFLIAASVLLIIWHVWVYGPTSPAVKDASTAKPFSVLLGAEIWDLMFSSHGMVAELWDVFPYFIVGILLAGLIRTYKITAKLQNTLRRYGFLSVFLASFVGILTPLCACGTLTTAISLLFAGMPLAPVMSLLVTSPLLSPSTYLLTLNDLGPEWTAIRTISAFSMGILAGTVTHLLRNKGFQTKAIFIEGAIPRGDFHDEAYPDERFRCGCKEGFGNRVAAKTGNMFVIFLAKSSEMLWLVGKYVLVGVAIGAIVERYMPYEWIYRLFGQKDPLNIIYITLGTVPIFLHQISASSILYHIKSSLDGTLDGGAALAFMIGGPVTAMPAMIMFWAVFKKRVFFLYMAVCIAGTVIIAYAFQFLVFVPYADIGNPLLRHVSSLSGENSSVIEKQDKHVRVVMDPDGKAMIATYTNDIEGHGGIVFDSGHGRLLNESADKFDNREYISNIADWLEKNNTSPESRRIFIYNLFDKTGPDKNSFSADALAMLQKKGFAVTITDRQETPEVSEALLGEYSQIWLFFSVSGPTPYFSDPELETISRFIDEGKSMLIVAGIQKDSSGDMSAANQVSSRYGVVFSGSVTHDEELQAAPGSYFLTKASGILGRILKFVNKA